MEKLTPFSIIKEIGEEHNVAVALIVGAIVVHGDHHCRRDFGMNRARAGSN